MDVNQSSETADGQSQALVLRYGAGAEPPNGPWNDVIASLLSHRSIRGFLPDPLPPHTLDTLIAAAQSASTSSNLQTWSVVAVTDPAKRAVLAKIASNQQHIEQCPLFLVWLADLSRNQRLGTEEGVTLETIPHFESYLVAAIDAALAAQNATVAAESLGLSMVYIGALRNDPIAVARLLELPPGAMAVFGMCVGYALPAVANEVKPRLPQSAILFHDRYDASGESAARAAYDARMAAFSRRHDMTQDTWTRRVIGRMGKIAAMSGRHRLVAILQELGFPLR